MVENMLYVSGGRSGSDNSVLTAILSWDPVQEKWTHAGDLRRGRFNHAVVAIPSDAIECLASLK